MALVRTLNEKGLEYFRSYLTLLRFDPYRPPPMEILTDGEFTEPFESSVEISPGIFGNAYDFGLHLVEMFVDCEDRLISRNYGLWSWLALFYFDQLCRPNSDGSRKVKEDALYVLGGEFNFRRYYRHLVRTPWLAVKEHGVHAKVLLITSGRGVRSDIGEQLGAQQFLFGNRTFIEAAYAMYFDESTRKPRRGAGGKGAGSPRRLASITRQLELTYDLPTCGRIGFLSLLPRKEFKKWIDVAISYVPPFHDGTGTSYIDEPALPQEAHVARPNVLGVEASPPGHP